MKVTLFFILMLSVMLIPVNAESINPNTYDKLTEIENQIKEQMKLKSQMPETMENAIDYWCLNDHLYQIVYDNYDEGYRDRPSIEELEKIIDIINQNYIIDKNFTYLEPGFIPDMVAVMVNDTLWITMDAHNPLKIEKAYKILDTYDVVVMRSIVLGTTSAFGDSCKEPLERQLGINVVQASDMTYLLWMNMRGDLVNLKPSSVQSLLERDYLLVRYNMNYFFP